MDYVFNCRPVYKKHKKEITIKKMNNPYLIGPKNTGISPVPQESSRGYSQLPHPTPQNSPKGYFLAPQKQQSCRITSYGCLTGTVIFALFASLGVALLSAFSISYSMASLTAMTHDKNGPLPDNPLSGHLDSSIPLVLTLPNDLQHYVGRTYAYYSRSAQPHVIQIESGTLVTTWDGTNKKATFGGAKGDGIVFHVYDRNAIAIVSNTNVVFSP